MKNQTILKKFPMLLLICFVAGLAFSACESTGEHPKGAEHPKQEHPKKP